MKILKDGKCGKDVKLRGACHWCWCAVECEKHETREMVDRDTREGCATRYIKCPQCDNEHLWLRPVISQ